MDLILAIVILATSSALAIFLIVQEKRSSSFQRIKIRTRKKKSTNQKKIRIYNVLKRLSISSYLVQRIERSISPNAGERDTLKIIVFDILKKSLLVIAIISVLIAPFIKSVRIFTAAFIGLIFILFSTIDYFTSKVKIRLLNHLVDFLDILRTKYFEVGGRVDSALLETIQSFEVEKHENIIDEIEVLHNTIENPDPNLALRDYYQVAPNSYFRILAGLLAINKESGDTSSERGSNFAKSLVDLGSEIKDEIRLRDKLNFSLKSLNFIAIAPLFIMNPLRSWASSNFYPLQRFYNSSFGFLTEAAVLISIILTQYGISRIQRFREETPIREDSKIAKKIYTKIKPAVDFIKPEAGSKRYRAVDKKQKKALDFSKQEIHYTKKIIASILALMISLSLFLYASHINRAAILNTPTPPSGYLGGELKGDNLEKAKETSKMDREMILKLQVGVSAEKIIDSLEGDYGLIGDEKNEALERIIAKYREYESNSFSAIQVIICYIISMMGFFLRDASLWIKRRIVNMDSMTEVSKFQLIILLLMHIKTIGVDDLLEWMEMFSSVYKTPLRKAIMDYDSGAEESLTELKFSSDDDEFKKLVDHLISAVDKISIKTSFEELENEKKFYELKRRSLYEKIVEKKTALGRMVGFIPIYSLILIYFMFPLIYSGMGEIDTYFRAFSI